jgi:Na+-transporting methylmalonyl-CoA/oxaloacetate decarboxylase gamma subunit
MLMTSLWITLVGMGIVFGAIIVLWGLMLALTKFLTDKSPASNSPKPAPVSDSAHKATAAALAVAVALAEQEQSTARPLSIPQTALVSAWQLGMRTRQMYQKGERIKTEQRDISGLMRGTKK